MKYIIKNCPAILKTTLIGDDFSGSRCTARPCKDVTDCVMKRIVDECNKRKWMKDKIIYFWLDILEFFGNIEMRIKHFVYKKYYNSLSEKDIPKETFYCYSGCRCFGDMCPYMDFSIIANSKYCHYVKGGLNEPLLWDSCKICGISEYEECE